VQTPEMELKLALLLYGTEMIYGRQFLEKNTNFLGNICREVKITI
jgi:hypothetical protein